MTVVKACLLCGTEDRDVVVSLVEIPKDEQRVVSVSIVTIETKQGPTAFDQRDVRERYAAMPRCRDRAACAVRVAAIECAHAPVVEPEPTEDPMRWL